MQMEALLGDGSQKICATTVISFFKPKYAWRRHIERSRHLPAESFRRGRRAAFRVLVQLPKPMQEGRWIVIKLGHRFERKAAKSTSSYFGIRLRPRFDCCELTHSA